MTKEEINKEIKSNRTHLIMALVGFVYFAADAVYNIFFRTRTFGSGLVAGMDWIDFIVCLTIFICRIIRGKQLKKISLLTD